MLIQQNVMLIQPQQAKIVTISIHTKFESVRVSEIQILRAVTTTISIVTTTILSATTL